jgi:hypothetical protein
MGRQSRVLIAVALSIAVTTKLAGAADDDPTRSTPAFGNDAALPIDSPRLAGGADLGVARYDQVAAASDFGFGPVAQVRIGLQIVRWLGLDARYFVTRHESAGALVTQGESIEARLSLPGAVRPYFGAGVGRYHTTAYDAAGRAQAEPDAAAVIPISLGVEVPVADSIGMQAEGTYRILFVHDLPDRSVALAQVWSATLGSRFYF